jgi:sugar lactone lactonase YvrE
LDPDLTVHRMDSGFICSNGIAFGPDDRRMTFADSFGSGVSIYDFDLENGLISGRRAFHQTAAFPWLVDGATFDTDGYYWCALSLASAIGRFDTDGRLVGLIETPMRHPTMCNFGGPDMDVLYVTSASYFLTEEEKPCQPSAGMLLAIRGLGVRGLPEPPFAG